VQHHFWHFMDETHDKHDPQGAKEFRHAIRETYQHIDVQLGQLLDECDDDTAVIIMSDHGFGPMTNVRVRLNQVLRDAGLLKFAESSPGGRWKQALAASVDRVLRSTLSPDMKRTIAGLLPKLRIWFENLDEAKIDWAATSAYVNEAYRSSPAIWLSRQNGGFNGERFELRERVEDVLASLVDPATGERLISNCYRPDEIYSGPHTAKAPEILPSWWEDGFLLEQSAPGKSAPPNVERSTAPIQGGVEFAASHRLDGVLMLSGGPLRRDFAFTGAKIVDVAPTVLYLMGLPVPEDMDGRVLTEAIDEDFVAGHPIRSESLDDEINDDGPDDSRHGFTEDESEMIARRLQALGYIQ
jgi:predicted AlkP superfamily phosphohydrolase/phosphomutase